MKLDLVFPDINRNKRYKAAARNYAVYVNSKKIYQINQDDSKMGSIEVSEGDKIFIQKRFFKKVDSSFYYTVGDNTAELINQQKKKKHTYVDTSDGVLFVLDDIDFNKVIGVAKQFIIE
tara:strand:- start:9731 stop:10087 length:357 start_codon:yes stop_codon:yes gene_type:complete